MDGAGDVEERLADFGALDDLLPASEGEGIVVWGLEGDVDRENALFADVLSDRSRVVHCLRQGPEFEVEPHQDVVKL